MSNALVLAAGGVAGLAWELGVLRGVADADPVLAEQVLAADLIVGTSAGSSAAAQITSGVLIDELYAAQLLPDSAELEVDVDAEKLYATFATVLAGASGPEDVHRRLGELAVNAKTVDPAARLAAIDARLPVKEWPTRDIRLPAVDADTGALVIFTRGSGVSLRDAVAASCAVPGVWPPVTINGRRYIDGGARSMTNADLAAGAERVLIIRPVLTETPQRWGDLDSELEALGSAKVHVIDSDEASVDAFGTNPLSPHTRGPSARAGREVGKAHAEAVAAMWA